MAEDGDPAFARLRDRKQQRETVEAAVSTAIGRLTVAITVMMTALMPKQAAATLPWRLVRSAR